MLISVGEAAKLRNTTRFSIHRWIKSGLPAQRIGEQWVIDRAKLLAFKPRPVGNPNMRKRKKSRQHP